MLPERHVLSTLSAPTPLPHSTLAPHLSPTTFPNFCPRFPQVFPKFHHLCCLL